MNGEDYLERERRRLAEGKERLEKVKAHVKAHDLMVDVAGGELEAAYDAYMEADTEEAWALFNEHMERARVDFRCAIAELHRLAEIIPSQIDPESERSIKAIIDRIANLRIGFWEKWGKRIKADREAVRRPHGYISCPSLLVHRGVKDMAAMSADDIEWCDKECPYREKCELPVPKP